MNTIFKKLQVLYLKINKKNISESPKALKKDTNNKTERFIKAIDSTAEKDSYLLLF